MCPMRRICRWPWYIVLQATWTSLKHIYDTNMKAPLYILFRLTSYSCHFLKISAQTTKPFRRSSSTSLPATPKYTLIKAYSPPWNVYTTPFPFDIPFRLKSYSCHSLKISGQTTKPSTGGLPAPCCRIRRSTHSSRHLVLSEAYIGHQLRYLLLIFPRVTTHVHHIPL